MIGYENCLNDIEFVDKYYAFLNCIDNLYIYKITLNKDRYITLLKEYGDINKIEFKCYVNPNQVDSYLNLQFANYLKEKRIVSVEYQKRELFKRVYSLSSFNLNNLREFFNERERICWEDLVNDFYSNEILEKLEWKMFFYSMVASEDDIYIKALKDLMLAYDYDEIAALPSKEFKNYANNLDFYYQLGFPKTMNYDNFDYYLKEYLKEAKERDERFVFLNIGVDFKRKLIPMSPLK